MKFGSNILTGKVGGKLGALSGSEGEGWGLQASRMRLRSRSTGLGVRDLLCRVDLFSLSLFVSPTLFSTWLLESLISFDATFLTTFKVSSLLTRLLLEDLELCLLLDLDLLDLLEILDPDLLDLDDLNDLLDELDLLELELDLDLETLGMFGLGSRLLVFFGLSSSESSFIKLYSISTSFSFSSSPLVSIILEGSANPFEGVKKI